MAALIIEILHRHGSEYYPIDKPAIRAGRALDNDIILPDPSVSPHHFALRRHADGDYWLHSLADENGIRIGRRLITEPLALQRLPIEFDAGRTRIRVLDRTQSVAQTRLISCRSGGLCLFGNWGWALVMFVLFLLLSAFDNYLSTPQQLSWQSFWRDQLVISTTALSLSIGLLVLNRLTAHRWDYPSALSFVSLALITAYLLDQIVPFIDYFFTSPVPGYVISMLWVVLLLPFALGWFLIRLNHGGFAASVLSIVLLLTPAAYIQIKALVTHYDMLDDFSKKAFYSRTLYPLELRLKETISIDQFARLGGAAASADSRDIDRDFTHNQSASAHAIAK